MLIRVLARNGEVIGLKGVLRTLSLERGSGSGMCSIFRTFLFKSESENLLFWTLF